MFKKLRLLPVLSPVFVLLALPLKAETQISSIYDLSLRELTKLTVVTAASGFEQKASRAPATVTVITSEEWQAKGARLLSDVLATVPGFHVGKPQGDFTHKKFSIRGLSGFSSTQIKLLIDGEPFEYLQNSSLFVGFNLPLTSFKRIEVIKGPGSAIYGADAFGGVINLVSYQHHEMPSLIGARVGSFATTDFFARDHFSWGDAHFQWSLDYTRSDDDNDRVVQSDLQSFFDSVIGTSASRTPGAIDEHYDVLTLLAKWQWQQLSVDYFNWRNFDLGHGAGVAQALDTAGGSAIYNHQLKAVYDFSELAFGDLKATIGYKEQQSRTFLTVFPAGAAFPIDQGGNINFASEGLTLFDEGFIGTPGAGGDVTTLRLTHLFNATKAHLVRWEWGYEKQQFEANERKNFGLGILDGSQSIVSGELTDVTGTPLVFLPNIDRHFYYLSLQDEWQVTDDMQLTLGIRHDDYSDFGTTTNPRVGFIWQTSDDFTVKLFAGSAFRAPSISQLYAQNNPVRTGNTELGPENVDTLEAGFNVEYLLTQDLMLSLSLFDYHAKDLIAFAPSDAVAGNVAQNIGEQKGQGGEFSLKWKPKKNITVDFSYSFLDSEDEKGVNTADIPNKMAYLAVNWQINQDWHWFVDAKWVADRYRNNADLRAELADDTWLTSKLERKNIIKGLSIAFIAKNLLNTDAREPSDGSIAEDYPLAGRQLLVELSYLF